MTGLISSLELSETIPPEESTPEVPATDQLAAVRALVLRAHPDVVPELVAGDTIEALLASIEPAQGAHARLVAALGERADAASPAPGTPHVPGVPAGGFVAAVDPESLPAAEKIRRGIRTRRA